MNIFYVDKDPVLAAQALCDKHVVKMVLESAQLLCTTHHVLGTNIDKECPVKFYRKTHINHPCAIWARSSSNNYEWLCNHAKALCYEYTFRYDKIHASALLIQYCSEFMLPVKSIVSTPPALAMPDMYKLSNPVDSYRNYYKKCKMQTIQCNWTKRNKPDWV